jgi:hypothetical protein
MVVMNTYDDCTTLSITRTRYTTVSISVKDSTDSYSTLNSLTDTTCTYTYSNTDVLDIQYDVVLIKKLLKRAEDKLCKVGWIKPQKSYVEQKIISPTLKCVRLDGRGWANKK